MKKFLILAIILLATNLYADDPGACNYYMKLQGMVNFPKDLLIDSRTNPDIDIKGFFKFNPDTLTISDFYLNLGNQLGLSQKQITNLSQQKIAAGFTAPTQYGGTTGFWNTREDYVKAYQAAAHPFGHGLYGAEQTLQNISQAGLGSVIDIAVIPGGQGRSGAEYALQQASLSVPTMQNKDTLNLKNAIQLQVPGYPNMSFTGAPSDRKNDSSWTGNYTPSALNASEEEGLFLAFNRMGEEKTREFLSLGDLDDAGLMHGLALLGREPADLANMSVSSIRSSARTRGRMGG